MLTAARSGEVRRATWAEIDWTKRKWTAPAERMKARREHQVPLSGRSIEVLRKAEALADGSSALVFPGLRGKPLSDMVFTAMLRRLEIPAVAHGFRSSFKDWCIECTSASWELGETALAHNLGNSTEQAYAGLTCLNNDAGSWTSGRISWFTETNRSVYRVSDSARLAGLWSSVGHVASGPFSLRDPHTGLHAVGSLTGFLLPGLGLPLNALPGSACATWTEISVHGCPASTRVCGSRCIIEECCRTINTLDGLNRRHHPHSNRVRQA